MRDILQHSEPPLVLSLEVSQINPNQPSKPNHDPEKKSIFNPLSPPTTQIIPPLQRKTAHMPPPFFLQERSKPLHAEINRFTRRILRPPLETRDPSQGIIPIAAGPLIAEMEIGRVDRGFAVRRRGVGPSVVNERGHVEVSRVEV